MTNSKTFLLNGGRRTEKSNSAKLRKDGMNKPQSLFLIGKQKKTHASVGANNADAMLYVSSRGYFFQ